MKRLTEIFPNASQSCRLLNSAILTPDPKKKRSTATTDAIRAILAYDETTNISQISDSKPQHHKATALDSTNAGKAKSIPRVRVRFSGYRVKPLDPDNFAGGIKDLLDGLRHAGLIQGDENWRIILQTEQEKVEHYCQERTVIEIEPVSEHGKGIVPPVKPKEVLASGV